VVTRIEIGPLPARDRSTSGSRSVRLRAIIGNLAARRPLRITTASTIPWIDSTAVGLRSHRRVPSPGQEPASL